MMISSINSRSRAYRACHSSRSEDYAVTIVVLGEAAASLQATPMQIALAWLLQRSSNILLIPGTSSVAHLRENLAAATMELPSDAITQLDGIAGGRSAANLATH